MIQRPDVGFVGLGAMGLGMATHLAKSGYRVKGFDMNEAAVETFKGVGGSAGKNPRDAARDAEVFVCMVATAHQCSSVFFDEQSGAVQSLPQNATIIICSTVPPNYPGEVLSLLSSKYNRSDIQVLDCPVSGGTVRAAQGDLVILASGSPSSLETSSVKMVLESMADSLHIIHGGLGTASKVKLINQQLAGIHIAATAEAMAIGAVLQVPFQSLYNVVVASSSWSWMFENRGLHIVQDDFAPYSALEIFVKDMGIVTAQGREEEFPLPLSSTAEQLYLAGHNMGLGRTDDSGLIKFYLQGRDYSSSLQAQDSQSATDVPTSIRMIIDYLASIHLAAAVEALSLTVKLSLELVHVAKILGNAAGSSSAFRKEASRILSGDVEDAASINDCLKALVKVLETAKRYKLHMPLAAGGLQIYQLAALNSSSGNISSSLTKVWGTLGESVIKIA